MLPIALALLPLVSLVYLLLFRGTKLLPSAAITAFITLCLVYFYWDIPLEEILWSNFKALSITFDIFLIVFGALLFQGYLKMTGQFSVMIAQLENVTSSRWMLILVLSWCFGAFLEGISGFGAPAALLGPFLVGLGLLPLEAIVVCLLANSTAVTFGAMGTPLRVGMANYVTPELVSMTSLMNLSIGVFIPILIVHFLRRRKLAPTHNLSPYLWAIVSGIALLVPYYGMSFYALEFPTVIGGGVGFFVMIFILKIYEKGSFSLKKLLWSFYPYWPVIILLFIGRYFFGGVGIRFPLGSQFSHTFNFFHPGLILLSVVLVLGRVELKSFRFLLPMVRENQKKLGQTSLSLFFMSLVSTLFLVSESSAQRGMLSLMGDMLQGDYYRFYAVYLGAFGSFLTGSATVSNLLFSPLQVEISKELLLNQNLILALQLSGGAMGNMISLLNIISVEGALGLSVNLKKVFSYVLPYCFLMLTLFATVQILNN